METKLQKADTNQKQLSLNNERLLRQINRITNERNEKVQEMMGKLIEKQNENEQKTLKLDQISETLEELREKFKHAQTEYETEKAKMRESAESELRLVTSKHEEKLRLLEDQMDTISQSQRTLLDKNNELHKVIEEKDLAILQKSELLSHKEQKLNSNLLEWSEKYETERIECMKLTAKIEPLINKIRLAEEHNIKLEDEIQIQKSQLNKTRDELEISSKKYDEMVKNQSAMNDLKILLDTKLTEKAELESRLEELSTKLNEKIKLLAISEKEVNNLKESLTSAQLECKNQSQVLATQRDQLKFLEQSYNSAIISHKDSVAKYEKEISEVEIRRLKEIQFQANHLEKLKSDLAQTTLELQKKICECDELRTLQSGAIGGNSYVTQQLKELQIKNHELKWNYDLKEQLLDTEKQKSMEQAKNLEKLSVELQLCSETNVQMDKDLNLTRRELENVSEHRNVLKEEIKRLLIEKNSAVITAEQLDLKLSKLQNEIAKLTAVEQIVLGQLQEKQIIQRKAEKRREEQRKIRDKKIQYNLTLLDKIQQQKQIVEEESGLNEMKIRKVINARKSNKNKG